MGPVAKRLIILLCLCGIGEAQEAPTAAELPAQTRDSVAMTVGERKVTVAELCTAIGQLPPPQRNGYALHPGLAKDWYGPLVALAEEAKREHLAVTEGTKLSEVDRDNALVGELIQAIAKESEPSKDDIETYYAAHKSEFEQAKVRHILVSDATAPASRSKRTETEAKARAEAIAAQLRSGADFAELAGKNSDDPHTASKGGELGYVTHHQLEPAVDEKVWSRAPGRVSEPFEGRFGYEIVEVEERREQGVDEVWENIAGRLTAAALERKQQEIVAAAYIRLEPGYADASLPCESGTRAFTLPNTLQGP